MKRFLMIVLLVASTAQANELKKVWNNFGKQYRLVSGAKAAVVGFAAYQLARASFDHGVAAWAIATDDSKWLKPQKFAVYHGNDEKIKLAWFVRCAGIAGATGFAAWDLGYYQFFKDAKHALNVKDGWFS